MALFFFTISNWMNSTLQFLSFSLFLRKQNYKTNGLQWFWSCQYHLLMKNNHVPKLFGIGFFLTVFSLQSHRRQSHTSICAHKMGNLIALGCNIPYNTGVTSSYTDKLPRRECIVTTQESINNEFYFHPTHVDLVYVYPEYLLLQRPNISAIL